MISDLIRVRIMVILIRLGDEVRFCQGHLPSLTEDIQVAWLFLLHLLLLLVHPEEGKLGVGQWWHGSLRGGGWHDGHV